MNTGSPNLSMAEWRRVLERCRTVPAHSHSVRLAHEPSQGFQLVLNHFVGGTFIEQRLPQGLQGLRFQLCASLFDVSRRHFFGRTWKGPLQRARDSPGRPNAVPFNEVLYFHTTLRLPSVVAVVEVAAVVDGADGPRRALSCGFGILWLFSGKVDLAEPPDSQGSRRLTLYHGSPRALLHPSLHEPIEQHRLMTPIEGAYLHYTFQQHPPLDPVLPLLPQNILVSGSEPIPGVMPLPDSAADALRKPRLLKSHTYHLDKLSITLWPSLEKFEEELLHLLNADRLSQRGCETDGAVLEVQERRLHVGVHNGHTFLGRPQVVLLEPEIQGTKGQQRTGSLSQDSDVKPSLHGATLCLRSRLHMKGMVNHPAFAIVFQLEYVLSVPAGADGKLLLASSSRMTFVHCVRWAAWCPPLEVGDVDVASEACLPLEGGAGLNPGGVMVYAAPHVDWGSTKLENSEGGLMRFRFTFRAQEQTPGTSIVTRNRPKDTSWHKRSPSPRRGGKTGDMVHASPPKTPQGPGLSISQLTASPRYPTISHSVASPWQQRFPSQLYPSVMAPACQLSHTELPYASSITHLETGLSRSPPETSAPDEEPLQEVTFTPVHAPVIALGTHTSTSSSSMSRSSMAHLYSAGFPEILDSGGQVAEVLDPAEPVNFNPQKEEADLLQCNKLVLQFLAFSRVPQDGTDTDWPKSVYFTFQVYRFPPVKTQRLLLLGPDKAERLPCILTPVNTHGSTDPGSLGLELTYLADANFLKPGERRWFLRYLALYTLQIDVWDGDSLLLIGSAAAELKHMLRQGRPAVQVMQELEVITTEYLQDAPAFRGDAAGCEVSVFTAVRGKLYLRLGNVGLPVHQSVKRSKTLPPSHSRIVLAQHDFSGGFGGGGLSSRSVLGRNERNTCHAKRLVDIDADLSALLRSRLKEPSSARGPAGGQTEAETEVVRQRKLARMEAVREFEGEGHIRPWPRLTSHREERVQLVQDLGLIEAYRERHKAESIGAMLSQAITVQHTVYAALGTAEFFEFSLRNPFNVPQTLTIDCKDPELSVIIKSEEWRHFKELTKTLTPLEEDMIHLREGTLTPQVYLRPRETVHIPLKYQTFSSQCPSHEPTDIFTKNSTSARAHQLSTAQARVIKVVFRAEDGKPVAICQVNVQHTPHVVDQTFRFYHPELTFLKKAIRLPPRDNLPGAGAGGAGAGKGQRSIYVRCSEPNVICDSSTTGPGEPQDVFLKVPGVQSPQIKKFFIAVFV